LVEPVELVVTVEQVELVELVEQEVLEELVAVAEAVAEDTTLLVKA
jgi:hypothetical protein